MLGDLTEEFVTRRKQSIVTRIVFGVFIVLLLSVVMSCQELRYMVSGKTVETFGVPNTEVRTTKYGDHVKVPTISYNYQDGDVLRTNIIEAPAGYTVPADGKIQVQYIPGRDTSRLLGQTNKVWVYIFFGSLIAAVLGIFLLVKLG